MGGHRFGLFAMVIGAAKSGIGAALLPEYIIETELEDGSLVILADLPVIPDDSYYLVVPEDKKDNPSVQKFCQWSIEKSAEGVRKS